MTTPELPEEPIVASDLVDRLRVCTARCTAPRTDNDPSDEILIFDIACITDEAADALEDSESLRVRAEAERDEALKRFDGQSEYAIDLQRIIEGLCHGDNIREPTTGARYHFDMAVAASAEQAKDRTDMRHWREECGKLHAQLRIAEASVTQLRARVAELEGAAGSAIEAFEELMTTLRREAPGTWLNNHRFDWLGIRVNKALEGLKRTTAALPQPQPSAKEESNG